MRRASSITLLIALILLAGCSPAPTPEPTDTPMPTATLSAAEVDALGPQLCEAVRDEDLAEVQRLIGAGVDVNEECGEGFAAGATPLTTSAQGDSGDIMQLLIGAGADLDHRTNTGFAALSVAVARGQVDMVRALVDAGADPSGGSSDVSQPLWTATRAGHTEIVQVLLDAGADPKGGPSDSEQPLVTAIAAGQTELVQILLDGGADPHLILDSYAGAGNATMLMAAAEAGEPDIVSILVDAGVDVDLLDSFGDHALNWTLYFQQDIEMILTLIDVGSEINFVGFEGRTALDRAILSGDQDIIDLLLDAGALTAEEMTDAE